MEGESVAAAAAFGSSAGGNGGGCSGGGNGSSGTTGNSGGIRHQRQHQQHSWGMTRHTGPARTCHVLADGVQQLRGVHAVCKAQHAWQAGRHHAEGCWHGLRGAVDQAQE